MYEKYFREFVAFLFPNDLLDESFIDFIEGAQTLEDAEKYGREHNLDMFNNHEIQEVFLALSHALSEMKKDASEHPKKDLIDYFVDSALNVLRKYNPPNIDNLKSFRTFLMEAEK